MPGDINGTSFIVMLSFINETLPFGGSRACQAKFDESNIVTSCEFSLGHMLKITRQGRKHVSMNMSIAFCPLAYDHTVKTSIRVRESPKTGRTSVALYREELAISKQAKSRFARF